jgi:antitoxin HicB
MKIVYPAIITKDKGGRYLVTFPDLPEAVTEGETMEEALFNASEVLTLTLEGRAEEGMEIPTPSTIKNAHEIAPSARVQAALLLRMSRGKKKVADIARALHTSWPSISRLEDPTHWPSLKQLEKVAATLGKRLVLNLE